MKNLEIKNDVDSHRPKQAKLTIIVLLYTITFLFAPACDSSPYKQGKNLYVTHCQNCHQEDGNAVMGLIPPIAGSDYLAANQDNLPCLIRYGLNEPITVNGMPYHHEMPKNEVLSETQIANVINYINNAWGNKADFVSYDMVLEGLKKCE